MLQLQLYSYGNSRRQRVKRVTITTTVSDNWSLPGYHALYMYKCTKTKTWVTILVYMLMGLT